MLARQRIQRVSAVSDGAHHAGNPIGHTGMRPDLAGIGGVGFGKLDRVHLGGDARGDAQRTVTAVGAKFQGQFRVGAPDSGVEQRAFLVADIDQHRLLVGEPVDGCQDVVDVARPRVLQHVFDYGGFAPVADLARRGDVAGPAAIRHTDHRNSLMIDGFPYRCRQIRWLRCCGSHGAGAYTR